MNFVTGLLLGLAICNGVMTRNVNGGNGGNESIDYEISDTIKILAFNAKFLCYAYL